jgi:hypothetical protein
VLEVACTLDGDAFERLFDAFLADVEAKFT